jgi:hypothetical protein
LENIPGHLSLRQHGPAALWDGASKAHIVGLSGRVAASRSTSEPCVKVSPHTAPSSLHLSAVLPLHCEPIGFFLPL